MKKRRQSAAAEGHRIPLRIHVPRTLYRGERQNAMRTTNPKQITNAVELIKSGISPNRASEILGMNKHICLAVKDAMEAAKSDDRKATMELYANMRYVGEETRKVIAGAVGSSWVYEQREADLAKEEVKQIAAQPTQIAAPEAMITGIRDIMLTLRELNKTVVKTSDHAQTIMNQLYDCDKGEDVASIIGEIRGEIRTFAASSAQANVENTKSIIREIGNLNSAITALTKTVTLVLNGVLNGGKK